jgi:tetratricopeptide (TPR) repeat protein
MEYRIAMNSSTPRPRVRRTPLVLAALIVIAVLGFAVVSRLVTRLKANEKQIAWHAFQAGLAQSNAGNPEAALDDFRAALTYDPGNSNYQLSLARALRDTGRLDESEAHLLHLWNATPDDSTVNLALARLAARRHSVDTAIRYYHNAIYGAWRSDPDLNRRRTRIELIEFLLQQQALPQAQAELVALAQILPPDPAQHLTVADLFVRARDYVNALAQYQLVLKLDPKNVVALRGAGEAAFQLSRYRTAEKYLQQAVHEDPQDQEARQQLETATLVLSTDPFLRRISDTERNRRIAAAFAQAGERLKACAQSKNIELPAKATIPTRDATPNSSANDLQSLWARWQAARPLVRRLSTPSKADLPDTLMDLILQIEQQTAQQCGQPSGTDLALLLISHDRQAVDQ